MWSSDILCRAPRITYSMHVGSGALLSIGLLRQLPFDKMEDCLLSQWSSGNTTRFPADLLCLSWPQQAEVNNSTASEESVKAMSAA